MRSRCIFLFQEQELHQHRCWAALLVRRRPAQGELEDHYELDWGTMDNVSAASRVRQLFAQDDEDEEHERGGDLPEWHTDPGCLAEEAVWLGPLLRHWYRLHDLQALSLRFGPAYPVLDPLAMEFVLAPQCPEREAPLALQYVGNKVLLLIASIVGYDERQDPESMVQHALLRCMSAPAAKTLHAFAATYAKDTHGTQNHTDMGESLRSQVVENMPASAATYVKDTHGTQILKALFGQYFLYNGGGFYTVWRVLRWLVANVDSRGPIWVCDKAETILAHYLFGATYSHRGRTPTFTSLTDIKEPRTDCKLLQVQYSNEQTGGFTGSVRYRRSPPDDGSLYPGHVQECILDDGVWQAWRPLHYSPNYGTFISNTVLYEEGGNLEAAPGYSAVPNKIADWIEGQNMRRLVRQTKPVQKRQDPDVEIELLQEQRGGELRVKYRGTGWFRVLRGKDGSMGDEQQLSIGQDGEIFGEARPIFWSQAFKCLMSSFTMCLVPKIIADFLQSSSLAHLVPKQKSHRDTLTDSGTVGPVDGDVAKWFYNGRTFTYVCERTCEGCMFVEVSPSASAPLIYSVQAPLIYSVQDASWLSPSIDKEEGALKAQLPQGILTWINECRQRTEDIVRGSAFTMSKAPCLKNPLKATAVGIVTGAELPLDHAFSNRSLLLEAFTPGVQSSLASLGSRLIETLLTEQFAQKTHFQLLTLRTFGRDQNQVAAATISGGSALESFAVQWLCGEKIPVAHRSWVPLEKSAQNDLPIYDAAGFQDLLDACNNNVVYAYACVNLGLHKFINSKSTELLKSAADFARFARRRAGPAVLAALLRNDAPRFLGQTFAASAAAIFLDTDMDGLRKTFMPILESQVLSLMAAAGTEQGFLKPWIAPITAAHRMAVAEGGFQLRQRGPADMTNKEVSFAMWDAHNRGVFRITPPRPPPLGQKEVAHRSRVPLEKSAQKEVEKKQGQDQQRSEAFALDDFHIFQAVKGNVDSGPPVMATSPRTAKLRCALLFLNDGKPFAEEEEEGVEEEREDDPQSVSNQSSPGGPAVWCEVCEMWLTGPTQWEDHKIGKKHKRNANKKEGSKAIAAGKRQPAGKKSVASPQESDQVQQQQPPALMPPQWTQHAAMPSYAMPYQPPLGMMPDYNNDPHYGWWGWHYS